MAWTKQEAAKVWTWGGYLRPTEPGDTWLGRAILSERKDNDGKRVWVMRCADGHEYGLPGHAALTALLAKAGTGSLVRITFKGTERRENFKKEPYDAFLYELEKGDVDDVKVILVERPDLASPSRFVKARTTRDVDSRDEPPPYTDAEIPF